MAVFRVERNTGYTVMSNHHLRNKELSLKAKGLLSQMLSLPEDWDYTLAGLSHINREKIDAIREAVKELEKAGYIVRSRERDEKGRLRGADYVIYEQPQPREPEAATSGGQPPILDLPTLENPTLQSVCLYRSYRPAARQAAAARWISPHCCSGRKIDLPKYDTGLQGHRIPVNSAVVPCSRYSQGSAGKYITRRLPFCGSRRIHFSRLL